MSLSKYTRTPQALPPVNDGYLPFNLTDNPFPYDPFVEPDSENVRVNGTIYNERIKSKEIGRIRSMFLSQRIDGNHKRLGYLVDSSYTGRGNGKSAFLVHLLKEINTDYGEKISDSQNKVFGVYVKPKSGGHSVKYWQFCEDVLRQLIKTGCIKDALIAIFLKKVLASKGIKEGFEAMLEAEGIDLLFDQNRVEEFGVSLTNIKEVLRTELGERGIERDWATKLAYNPLAAETNIIKDVCEQNDAWKKRYIMSFLFDQIVRLMVQADFNGGYILLDEFEKIAEYQKLAERNDFANGLRENLYDGGTQSAVQGFFMTIIAMHPGTPNLVSDAWEKSGLNARAPLPIGKGEEEPHILLFHNVGTEDAKELMQVYLDHFRLSGDDSNKLGLYPFDDRSIAHIATLSDFNIAKMLRFAHIVLGEQARLGGTRVTVEFVDKVMEKKKGIPSEDLTSPDFLHREKSPMSESLKGLKAKQ